MLFSTTADPIERYGRDAILPATPFINLPWDFRARLVTIFLPRNNGGYKPHKSWSPMFLANSFALAAGASCANTADWGNIFSSCMFLSSPMKKSFLRVKEKALSALSFAKRSGTIHIKYLAHDI